MFLLESSMAICNNEIIFLTLCSQGRQIKHHRSRRTDMAPSPLYRYVRSTLYWLSLFNPISKKIISVPSVPSIPRNLELIFLTVSVHARRRTTNAYCKFHLVRWVDPLVWWPIWVCRFAVSLPNAFATESECSWPPRWHHGGRSVPCPRWQPDDTWRALARNWSALSTDSLQICNFLHLHCD